MTSSERLCGTDFCSEVKRLIDKYYEKRDSSGVSDYYRYFIRSPEIYQIDRYL